MNIERQLNKQVTENYIVLFKLLPIIQKLKTGECYNMNKNIFFYRYIFLLKYWLGTYFSQNLSLCYLLVSINYINHSI